MSFARQLLGVDLPLPRDKADALLLLVASAIVMVPHFSHLPIWTSLLLTLLWSWRVTITLKGHRLPPQWLLLPIATVGMGLAYREYHMFFGRDPGVAMVTILFMAKLLEMQAKRDAFVVLMVSLFLILSNFLYSQSIGMAFMMIAAVLGVMTSMLSFQFVDRIPPLRQRLRLVGTVFAFAVPLTVVLFLLFPRIDGPLWGMPGDAHSGKTGMSDTMSPGNISNLAQSEEIAFRVRFLGAQPTQAALYWRVFVMQDYDGSIWHRATPIRPSTDDIDARYLSQPIDYEITLEANGQHWLPVLDLPQTLPVLSAGNAVLHPNMEVTRDAVIDNRLRYRARSYLQYRLDPTLSPDQRNENLALPFGFNPRAVSLGGQMRAQISDPLRLAQRILDRFHRESYSYTLEPPVLGRNAIDEFLLETRAGFCEHYASAFVVLMRAAGVPARVVTGYQGGELNTVDNFVEVRQSEAHAWAEIWIPDAGWIRVDPTAAVAPERVQRNLQTAVPAQGLRGLIRINPGKDSWLNGLRMNWNAMSNRWNQWVLNYSSQRQRDLLKQFGFDEPDWSTMGLLLMAACIVILGLSALWLFRGRSAQDPAHVLYLALCRSLARHGLARADHEGPRSYATRIAACTTLAPNQRDAALQFVQAYERYRYAPQGDTRQLLAQLKSLHTKIQ